MHEQMNQEELQKIETMKKVILRKVLSKQAMERLARIRMVKPEIATQLELYLVDLYQAGKIKSEVSEEQMKMILETVSMPNSREFRIMRK